MKRLLALGLMSGALLAVPAVGARPKRHHTATKVAKVEDCAPVGTKGAVRTKPLPAMLGPTQLDENDKPMKPERPQPPRARCKRPHK